MAKLGRFAKKSWWDRHRPPWWTAILAAVLRQHKIRAFLRLVDTIALQAREFESNPIRKARDKITHNNQPWEKQAQNESGKHVRLREPQKTNPHRIS